MRTNQLDFDDEVIFAAEREIYDKARGIDPRPLLLVASLTHPHDPYAITAALLEPLSRRRDRHARSLDPARAARSAFPPAASCLRDGRRARHDEQIRAARRAYYGEISYVDDNLGRLMRALRECGLADETIVVFLGDHGEMLGERGLWYKMSFFEGPARVPLIVAAPGRLAPRRVATAVSLLDVTPTLVDLAGGDASALDDTLDGRSLVPHLETGAGHDEAIGEYLAEGAAAPIVMIRRRNYKFIHASGDPDQLYDLKRDPGERENLAPRAEEAERVDDLRREVARRWNLPALDAEVRASQRRRRLVDAALNTGATRGWDFQPIRDASKSYVRNTTALDDLEAMARFPRVAP